MAYFSRTEYCFKPTGYSPEKPLTALLLEALSFLRSDLSLQ